MTLMSVSICIPSYKHPEQLKRLLDSIMIQDYKDVHVIITDDTRTDEIKDLIASYEGLDITYEKNITPLGATGNTIQAMKLAKDGYIKIMHRDDSFATPGSLRQFVKGLDDNPESFFFFSGTREVYYENDGSENHEKTYKRAMQEIEEAQLKDTPDNLFVVNMVGAPSSVILRDASILPDKNLTWLIDSELYIHILKDKGSNAYSFTRECLINIGHDGDQLTDSCRENAPLMIKDNVYVFNKYGLLGNKNCRKFLCREAIRNRTGYGSIKASGISYAEYAMYAFRAFVRRNILKNKKELC